jgi:hypothetical protein
MAMLRLMDLDYTFLNEKYALDLLGLLVISLVEMGETAFK